MENIAINKRFQDLHFDSIQALRGLAALFVVFQHVRFLKFRCLRGRHIFLYQRVYDHVHHRKKYKILLPETSDPDSAAVLSDDIRALTQSLLIIPVHVPADQTQSFATWSRACCLFLLISVVELSSLWCGSDGLSTVKCCSICYFSLPFISA